MGQLAVMEDREQRPRPVVSDAPRARSEAERTFVQLPTDVPPSADVGYTAALLQREGPAATDVPTVLGALTALLHRYTQQATIALDAFVSDDAGLPVRLVLDAAITGADPISDVFEKMARNLTTQLGARERLALAPSDDAANIAVTFGPPPRQAGAVGGAVRKGAQRADKSVERARPYELHLYIGDGPVGLAAVYNANLFAAATIDRLTRSFLHLLRSAIDNPDTPVARLPLVLPADLRRITHDWDSGPAARGPEPVHHQFEGLARTQPLAVAATFQNRVLTYGELDERSSRLAQHLVAAGVEPGTRVAVCVPPSLDIVVAILGIFKAGGIYVPLDPTHPEAFIATIIDEARPRLVLTHSKLKPLTRPERYPQLCFDTDWAEVQARPAVTPLLTDALAARPLERPAYLLYTSGTTGKPKGVIATHANLGHYIHAARKMYGFGATDVFCSLARYTFSISLFELLSPLCCGGSLRLLERDEVLAPERLARVLHEVTVVHAGPSLLGNLFRYLRSGTSTVAVTLPNMRHASSGGDLVPPYLLEEMKGVFPNAELFVIYGCTEISCMGTTYPVDRTRKVACSFVGKAFPDVAVRVLDPNGALVPPGVVGEICFAGEGVVPGYLDRPELTAQKFVDLEVAGQTRRYYKTGDMGRLHEDGHLEILGRRDFQVQLRGIRIELGGIENTIRELGLAAQCAVVMKKLDEQDVRLVCYVVKPRDENAQNVAWFRKTLAQLLPDYMLPQHLVVLEAMPLTTNGKLDRNRLSDMPLELRGGGTQRTAPRNALERTVASAFARSLGVEAVGIDDDFFALGGHSLLAVTVTQELENTLGMSLPPGVVFEQPTVRALAEMAQNPAAHVPSAILLSANANLPALFMIAGVQLYRPLAKRLEDRYAVYGVYAGRELLLFESSQKGPPVAELAHEYVDIIRRTQPHGPYRLAGMSFGGILVYEVAQQLRDAGEKVDFLGLLDAIMPDAVAQKRTSKIKRLFSLQKRDLVDVVSKQVRTRVQGLLARPDRHARFARFSEDAKLSPLEDRREDAYHLAAAAYVAGVRPYWGEVTLVVARRRMLDELGSADCGWRRFIRHLDVHTVDAEHLALLEEPKVKEVAQIFATALHHTEPRRPTLVEVKPVTATHAQSVCA